MLLKHFLLLGHIWAAKQQTKARKQGGCLRVRHVFSINSDHYRPSAILPVGLSACGTSSHQGRGRGIKKLSPQPRTDRGIRLSLPTLL